jgi:hypothetical protein
MVVAKIRSEFVEQSQFVQWFRRQHPNVLIYATPNGGARSPSTAARLKVEGVVAGIPDLFIPEWKLWIEMKRVIGGKVSAEQRQMIIYLHSVGYCVIICYGFDDAVSKVTEFLKEKP